MNALCPHEDDPQSCPPCVNARRPKPAPLPVEVTHAFPAAYPGTCACGLPIHVGQICRVVITGDQRRTVHDGCQP